MQEFTNTNRYRRYPFVDDADMDARLGDQVVRMPDTVLLDFTFTADIEYGSVKTLYLDYFDVYTIHDVSCCKLAFYSSLGYFYVDVPGNVELPYNHQDTISYLPAYRLRCLLGEGFKELCELPEGCYKFNNPPLILGSCIITLNNHRVCKIKGSTAGSVDLSNVIESGGGYYINPPIAVELEEGYNTTINLNEGSNTITIGAQVGAGKGVSCDTLTNARKPTDGFVSVNGVRPDTMGNINLEGLSGVTITQAGDATLSITTAIDDSRILCES